MPLTTKNLLLLLCVLCLTIGAILKVFGYTEIAVSYVAFSITYGLLGLVIPSPRKEE